MKNYPAGVLRRRPVASPVTGQQYLVAIKPSARRVSARVGRWVNREGTRRRFASKPLAREWARACCGTTATVWVQDAPRWADGPADGYLVGCRHTNARPESTGRQTTIPTSDG
jgi:hypothetical protein